MAELFTRAARNYSRRTHIVTEAELGPGDRFVRVTLSRENWPAVRSVVQLRLLLSDDGGATWKLAYACGLPGGVIPQLDDDGYDIPGTEEAESWVVWEMDKPRQCLLRVVLDATASMRTAVAVDGSDTIFTAAR